MEIKIKITYGEYGLSSIKAKIVTIYGWYDLPNKLSQLSITDNQVIKIERVLTVSDEETEDLTNN